MPAEAESVGVILLIDFLMGSSIDEVTRRHRLHSVPAAEAAIRALLLRHGYDAATRAS